MITLVKELAMKLGEYLKVKDYAEEKKYCLQYECLDEVPDTADPQTYVFSAKVDNTVNSLTERFQIESLNNTWRYLNNIKYLPDKNEMETSVSRLRG